MGIALIVPDADFSGANLGKVTLQGYIPVGGLTIKGAATVTGSIAAATYRVSFSPLNTTERGVAWSVQSGSSYASIGSSSGVLTVLEGATAASVTIRATSTDNSSLYAEKTITVNYSASGTEPTHTGAAYYIPLKANSTPSEGSLTVLKEDTTYDASNGALFDNSGEGLVYTLPEGTIGYAIAMDFYKKSDLGLSNGNYFTQIGKYNDTTSSNNDGISLFSAANGNNAQSSDPSDFTFASNAFTLDEWHRLCIAIIGTYEYLYIDGELIGSHSGFQSANSSGYAIIGNNWRYRKSDGDRVFGGYIKNVAIWTSEISQSDMGDFSTYAG